MTQVEHVFSNRYAVERPIARGGMADVYLARDQQLGRPVAVKVLFPEYARDPSFVERFRREAKNSAMLQHPNIVSVYDYGQERGTYFIVMEFVDGPSLRDVLHADGALPIMQAARIGSEIAAALDFADRHGVVHRDIKPGNVMIMPSGQVKVTDFGISANPMDANHGLTQTGAVIGTATYFSPEQAQGFQVDGRSDVYALGVVLYEMVTGQAPFSAESPVAVAMKHVREDPIPPSQLRPDVPPDLERIILKALSKSTQSRYQSAGELRADLIRFGRGQAVEAAVPPPAVEPPTEAATQYEEPAHHAQMWEEQPKRKGPIIATVIGLTLLAAAIIFAIFFLGNKSGEWRRGDKDRRPGRRDEAVHRRRRAPAEEGLQGRSSRRGERCRGRDRHQAEPRGRPQARKGRHHHPDREQQRGDRPDEPRRADVRAGAEPHLPRSDSSPIPSTRRAPTNRLAPCSRRTRRAAPRSPKPVMCR